MFVFDDFFARAPAFAVGGAVNASRGGEGAVAGGAVNQIDRPKISRFRQSLRGCNPVLTMR